MDVVSLHIDIISRRTGRSAVQMAAYCSRDKLFSDYTGKSYDYTDRHDLVYHEVMLPDSAPDMFYNSEILWNSVEKKEKAKNARLARTVIIALPKELNHDSHIKMIRQYAQKFFVQRGMCADISIHDKGDGNPHAHMLLTTRSINRDGEWMCKQRRNYLLDKKGNRLRDPITQQYKLGKSIKTNDWDSLERIEEWRKGWAEICQSWFKQCGISKEITHVSYARQGIDREPTIHLGAKVKALEKRGLMTDRGKKNRDIVARNYKHDRLVLRQRIEKSHDHELERDR
ncbi:MAG: MobA/MobL family protein [Lachnospiraceae bacterium]|nr:MobA/MobL family protein [Lachnospiraceae bacterium]